MLHYVGSFLQLFKGIVMANQVKKSTGLISPFLKVPQGLSTPDGDLHKINPELYAKIKQEHWGWVGVLKYYAETLHEASNTNVFVLEVHGNTQNFRINMRRAAVWPYSKGARPDFPLVISLSFGEYVPVDALFDLKTSNTVVAKTSSGDARQALDKGMLRSTAKRFVSGGGRNTARVYHIAEVLKGLHLVD